MKKYFLTFIMTSFLLIGCAQTNAQEATVNNPYEIIVNNELLSYYDTKDNFPNNFNVLEYSLEVNQNESDNIITTNKDNQIRFISITDSSVITYKQISVGDKVNKIEDNFTHEYEINNSYLVLFDGSSEEDPTNQNKEDDWIWISYITDGSKIIRIRIYDVKFGREMK